jgi:barrier-to-autointegration factor
MSRKSHRIFVSEPIQDKSVTELPGISTVLGKRLADNGFDKAYCVLGQYLLLKKDKNLFEEWLKMEPINANQWQASRCVECLNEWCEEFL